ncbi:MAG: response regulator [Saprospiraceae bacterium]
MQFKYFTFFILIFIVFDGKGQQNYEPKIVNPLTEMWRWKHFPDLEGKGVRHITEDENGKVWVSVDEGIYEYNGYDWQLYKKDKNTPLDTPIKQILITKDGKKYAISPRQIFQYKNNNWVSVFNTSSNYDFNFSKIIELSDGSLMVSSSVGVLHYQDSKRHTFYTSLQQISIFQKVNIQLTWKQFPNTVLKQSAFTNISDIIEDNEGNIWLAFSYDLDDSGQLLTFRPSDNQSEIITKYQFFTSNETLLLGEESKIIQSLDKKIWVINNSFKAPINVFDNGKWQSFWLSEQFGGDEYASDIVQTDDGTIWVGSLGKLYVYKNNKWSLYDALKYKIPRNKIQLYKGRNNKLWITGLLSKAYLLDYSANRWMTYQGLNFQCETKNGEKWYLDINGRVVVKNGEKWRSYGVENGLIDATVRIIATSKGQVWAAGSHESLAATAYLKNGKWYRQTHPKLSWGIDYRSVFEASDGSIWFGGSVDIEREKGQKSGIVQLLDPFAKDLKWRHFVALKQGYNQTNSYGIAETIDKRIWTGGSNLLFFDGQKWAKTKNQKLANYVNCLASTDDFMVVGSRYYGIFVYDGNSWKNYSTESGLANNHIISIDAINKNNIWVATENSICHFDGLQWQNDLFPSEMNMEIEGGDIFHSSDGSIWINHSPRNWKRRSFKYNKKNQDFTNTFLTYRYTPDATPPDTKITFFSKNVSTSGNTFIQWNGKDFFGETPNEQLTYSYRIDDGEWSLFSPEKQHTFLSLSDGKHKVEVRAKDLASNIDLTPAMVEFEVQPPVWKQTWFLLLVGTFLTTISIFGYNIFTKNKKLEKLNNNLQEANTVLKKQGKKISKQNTEILEQQTVILEQKQSLEVSNQNLEIRNKEIQLQRDKVEELSKAKVSFFTNISHELRTPLSLILGPVNHLKTDDELLENDKKSLYNIIERNSTRLLRLINQLLEIRRIENSSMALQLSAVNVNDYVFKVTELFKNLAQKRKVQLHFNSYLERKTFLVDADKLEKIVVNLVANAFKYTPEMGRIDVEINKVNATKNEALKNYENYIAIKITDTGKGMTKEVLEHIFERYYFEESVDKNQKNSGIGLSYVKDLVETHQGIIEVKSEVDLGSTFIVFIPVIEKDESIVNTTLPQLDYTYAQQEIEAVISKINKPEKTTTTNSKLPKILVVEDNLDMTLFIEEILKKDYDIVTAENGKIGLEIAQNNNFDLILSDIMMPKMDGLEFSKHIKSNFSTSHIPIILLTAKSKDLYEIEGYQTGADDYITKPFDTNILQLKIKNILDKRAAFQRKVSREFQLQPQQVEVQKSPDEEMLEKLIGLMQKNIDNSDFNVNAMCESVNLSHMHFIRKVKQLTGKRPVELLRSFRMKRAKDLLIQEKMTISEVAYSVGFDIPGSFSRAFKKEFGQSPSAFLNEL